MGVWGIWMLINAIVDKGKSTDFSKTGEAIDFVLLCLVLVLFIVFVGAFVWGTPILLGD